MPSNIIEDQAGNIYVAASESNLVVKIDPLGNKRKVIDFSGDGVNPLESPSGLAVDSSGNLYVSGLNSHNVFKISPAGTVIQILDVDGDHQGNYLFVPTRIAVDHRDHLFVVGTVSNNLFEVSPRGHISKRGSVQNPTDLVINSRGHLFVVSPTEHTVTKFSSREQTTIINSDGDGLNSLDVPTALALDGLDNIYVVGSGSHNVFKITPDGTVSQLQDSSGSFLSYTLFSPSSIAANHRGDLFIHNIYFDNIIRRNIDGSITEVLSSAGLPQQLAVRSNGSLLVPSATQNTFFEIKDPLYHFGFNHLCYKASPERIQRLKNQVISTGSDLDTLDIARLHKVCVPANPPFAKRLSQCCYKVAKTDPLSTEALSVIDAFGKHHLQTYRLREVCTPCEIASLSEPWVNDSRGHLIDGDKETYACKRAKGVSYKAQPYSLDTLLGKETFRRHNPSSVCTNIGNQLATPSQIVNRCCHKVGGGQGFDSWEIKKRDRFGESFLKITRPTEVCGPCNVSY